MSKINVNKAWIQAKIHAEPTSQKSFANQWCRMPTWHGVWRHRETSYRPAFTKRWYNCEIRSLPHKPQGLRYFFNREPAPLLQLCISGIVCIRAFIAILKTWHLNALWKPAQNLSCNDHAFVSDVLIGQWLTTGDSRFSCWIRGDYSRLGQKTVVSELTTIGSRRNGHDRLKSWVCTPGFKDRGHHQLKTIDSWVEL